MKSIYRALAIASLCGVLAFPPTTEARGRNNHSSNRPGNSAPASRPGNSGRPVNNRPQPQPSHGNHGGNNRPNPQPNYGNHGNHGNHGGNYRPNPRPDYGHHHGHNHGHGGFRPGPPPPPAHRPMLPPSTYYFRPGPPPMSYRPYAAWPTISSILGFRLGSAIGSVYGALMAGGYSVLASASDALYLNNVSMMNYVWPEAALTFNGAGALCGSEFISPSTFNDRMLFNNLYATLTANYGTPYNISNNGPYSSTISWWGPNGQYIRLNYSTGTGYDGITRFYTTLNFGVY